MSFFNIAWSSIGLGFVTATKTVTNLVLFPGIDLKGDAGLKLIVAPTIFFHLLASFSLIYARPHV